MPGRFSHRPPDSRSFLHALRQYLQARNRHETAALLDGASCAITPSSAFSADRWNALSTTVTIYVPGERLAQFPGKVRKELWLAADAVLPKDAGLDVEQIVISPVLQSPRLEEPLGLNAGMLAGQGPIDHDGLRFRSCAETRIHDALKRHPVLFFPNAAAVFGGDLEGKKREADFLVCSGGKWGMLEVMGEPYHPPVTAMRDHERARSFKDFGLRVIEFYDAARCLREPEMVVDDFLRRLENS